MVTKEMQAYMTEIVKERGITQETFTKEVCGDVMKEAVRRMDRAISRAKQSETFYHNFTSVLYLKIVARAALNA